MTEDVQRYIRYGLRYVLNIVLLLEILSLLYYFFLALGVMTPLDIVAGYEEQFFELVRPAAPFLMLLILFSWFTLFRKKPEKPTVIRKLIDVDMDRTTQWLLKHSLQLALLLSVIGALYPWSPYINPEHEDFGVDVKGYKSHFNEDYRPSSLLFLRPRMGLRLPIVLFHL